MTTQHDKDPVSTIGLPAIKNCSILSLGIMCTVLYSSSFETSERGIARIFTHFISAHNILAINLTYKVG
jgi:hypothetical protein